MTDEFHIQSGRDTIQAGGNIIQVGGDYVGGDKITTNYNAVSAPVSAQERRDRTTMLRKVQDIWIDGVLARSLHQAMLMELGMEYRQEAVADPRHLYLRQEEGEDSAVVPGTKIQTVFDQLTGELLILGGPGSGKTTLLLELTRDLLVRAEQDETHPIPVVFNLASWAEKRLSLAAWLVTELDTTYNISRKIGGRWIARNQILPLLDGLDEVHLQHREACVKAINRFRQNCIHGLQPIVVCSRVADYSMLGTKLRLRGAVLLQQLTALQVSDYFAGLPTDTTAMQAVYNQMWSDAEKIDNVTEQQLLRTPLMLNIIALTYWNQTLDTNQDSSLQRLFERYVQRMLRPRPGQPDEPYMPDLTKHWLTQLAFRMVIRGQAIFFIEHLNSSWFTVNWQRWLYFAGVYVLFAIILGSPIMMMLWQTAGSTLGLLLWFTAGIVGLVVATVFWGYDWVRHLCAAYIDRIQNDTIKKKIYQFLRQDLESIMVLSGSGIGCFMGLTRSIFDSIAFGCTGCLLAILVNLIGFTIQSLVDKTKNIKLIERLKWSWMRFLIALIVLPFIILTGTNKNVGENILLTVFTLLFAGLTGHEADNRTRPNEGVWRTGRYALAIGAFSGILGFVFTAFASAQPGMATLTNGLLVSFLAALYFGGFTFIQHYVIRVVLILHKDIPLKYAHFLDYAAERLLLCKVGGGYAFVHRTLLEYFASLEAEKQ